MKKLKEKCQKKMLTTPNLFSRFSSKVLLFNASPRKHCNTARVLESVKKGAESAGAKVELIHLYNLKYKGCSSCLECKKKNSPPGCSIKDGLTKYLKEVYNCDGLAIGTPLYCGNFAASYYSLYERLMYGNRLYELPPHNVKFPKRINTGLIFTMGVDEARCTAEYDQMINRNKAMMEQTLGPCTVIKNVKQLLTPNFEPYHMGAFNKQAIVDWVKEHDPIVLKQAFDLGVKLATNHP